MGRLIFAANDVRRVVEHSINAPKQSEQVVDYTKLKAITKPVEKPSVLLVHDDGVYLMSNGEPRDLVEPKSKDPHARSYVAHAKGCNPKVDSDWWDRSRELVGGDDFAETLPWAEAILEMLNRGAIHIIIDVKANELKLSCIKGRPQ